MRSPLARAHADAGRRARDAGRGCPGATLGQTRRGGVTAAGTAVDGLVRRRNSLDPVRYMLGHLADDVAYGTGVWAGALRARSTARSARSSPGTPSALAGQLLRNRLPDETTAIRLVHRCRTKEP